MINDTASLYNLALNAIGARNNVASPTENSREAQVCGLWYSVVKDQVFAAAPWPELTKLASLTLLDTRGDTDWVNTNAQPGFLYTYALPDDIARPQYLTDFSRFTITSYTDDQAILATNTTAAILAYTAKNLAVSLWGPGLQMAMVYALASHICMPLSGKVTRAKQMVDQANSFIAQAREISANTSNMTFDTVPDWISKRGYCGASAVDRYVYPMGELLQASVGVN